MSENQKFWIQTLLVPVILAVVGFFVSRALQGQQESLEKMKFADQIVNEAFDANNPDKAYAMVTLVPLFIKDDTLSKRIVKSINEYYTRKVVDAALTSNDSVYSKISDAAKTFGAASKVLLDTLNKNATTSKAEAARQFEQNGLKFVQQGKLELALENFKKSEATYPGFHSSYEISKLLNEKIKAMNETHDDPVKVQHEVQQVIKKKYAWKLFPAKK